MAGASFAKSLDMRLCDVRPTDAVRAIHPFCVQTASNTSAMHVLQHSMCGHDSRPIARPSPSTHTLQRHHSMLVSRYAPRGMTQHHRFATSVSPSRQHA